MSVQVPSVHEVDWEAVKEHAVENVDPVVGAGYDDIANAIEATHDAVDGLATGSLIKDAEDHGFLWERDGNYRLEPDEAPDSNPDDQLLTSYDDQDDIVIPETLRERSQWYIGRNKIPAAPWSGSTWVSWGMEADERYETEFEEAFKWYANETLHKSIDIDEEDLELCYLLPHYPDEHDTRQVSCIDLDSVRNPQTGEIHPEARCIIDKAGSYTEVSQSGTGIHVFVFGALPEWCEQISAPDIDDEQFLPSKFVDEEDEPEHPHVELYEKRKIVAVTGDVLGEYPTEVTDGSEVIEYVVDEYQDEPSDEDKVSSLIRDNRYDDSGNESPYFSKRPEKIINTSEFFERGGKVYGPHPVHGSQHGDNTLLTGETWRCWRHEVTGNALHMVGVNEPSIPMSCEDVEHGLDQLSDVEYLRLCLLARDKYGFDGKPPYRALMGVAEEANLATKNGRLYKTREVAETIYQNMDVSDLN